MSPTTQLDEQEIMRAAGPVPYNPEEVFRVDGVAATWGYSQNEAASRMQAGQFDPILAPLVATLLEKTLRNERVDVRLAVRDELFQLTRRGALPRLAACMMNRAGEPWRSGDVDIFAAAISRGEWPMTVFALGIVGWQLERSVRLGVAKGIAAVRESDRLVSMQRVTELFDPAGNLRGTVRTGPAGARLIPPVPEHPSRNGRR